ncbi:MAG: hypothetical protein SH856_13345 [Flavobacteriales bacterium]|nr:hypothetical protein [Flavobacteriales bacterium]
MRLYKNLLPGLLVLIFISCIDNNKQKDVDAAKAQLDLLRREVDTLKEHLHKSSVDSTRPAGFKEVLPQVTVEKELLKPSPTQLPSDKKEVKEEPVKKSVAEDTTKYFYKNPKRISLLISPWHNNKRKLIFYDPFGKITYAFEDVRLSYSEKTHVKKFHDNGSVAEIERSLNPGASIYWHQEKITFGISNNPEWKQSTEQPAMSVEDLVDAYWWDNATGQWRKQEVVMEDSAPKE